MTASLLLTISAMLAGLAAGELACWLFFDDDAEDTTDDRDTD